MNVKRTILSNTMLATVAIATLSLGAGSAAACGQDAYLGQICVVAGSYCPNGTIEANGQIIEIRENTGLFALIGCQYGGDCRNTMQVPDLRGRVATGYGAGRYLTPHPWGEKYGQDSVKQTVDMLVNHRHAATFTPAPGGTSGTEAQVMVSTGAGETNTPAGGKYLSAASATTMKIYNSGTTGTLVPLEGVSGGGGGGGGGGGVVKIENTGASAPMPTMPPSLAIRYCMVTVGIFPPRQ